MTAALERETEIFNKLLPQLLKDEGKYALVVGENLIGVFGTYEDALTHGYEKAKLNPFLVKKISGTETIAYFSRDIDEFMPHCTLLIDQRGPILNVLVGVSAPRRVAMHAAGIEIPAPVMIDLLVDTGAAGTSIDASIIAQLGLQPTGTMPIHTPSTGATPHICTTYDMEMIISGKGNPKIIPAMPVLDGHYIAQGHHGLLGRNVLTEGRLIYSGPDLAVMLSF